MQIPKEHELLRLIEPVRECSYLPAESASLEYRILHGISEVHYEELLRRGWRRFGMHFFRPACPNCTKCRSLRVDVSHFSPSKSQRRCEKQNADIEVEIDQPRVSRAHLDLYNAYHRSMHDEKGWREREVDQAEYSESFLRGRWSFAREFRYLRNSELIGVGLVDVVPTAMSSIYFYHAPEWRPAGPGTFSMLQELSYALSQGKRFHYLGYWITENRSMNYKASFRPHELLERYPADAEEPVWIPVEKE